MAVIDDEEEAVIGVKVLHNAPHPNLANKGLGKYLLFIILKFLTLFIVIAVVPTDEEQKALKDGPSIAELQKKKKEAAKKKPKTCRDPNAFNTYIYRVMK